jgi:hypothetical protein
MAQELEGVMLRLQWILLRVGMSVDRDGLGVHLGELSLAGDALIAGDGDAAAGGEVLDLGVVVGQRRRGDDRRLPKHEPSLTSRKLKPPWSRGAAHPALDADLATDGPRQAGLSNSDLLHEGLPARRTGTLPSVMATPASEFGQANRPLQPR